MDYGTLPQWVTAGVALASGFIAALNIRSQREIARKRAAFDVFLKTETDEKMLTAYDNFHAGVIEMKKAAMRCRIPRQSVLASTLEKVGLRCGPIPNGRPINERGRQLRWAFDPPFLGLRKSKTQDATNFFLP
jgi:hypothetical protein